jgi:hypothetical protein
VEVSMKAESKGNEELDRLLDSRAMTEGGIFK